MRSRTDIEGPTKPVTSLAVSQRLPSQAAIPWRVPAQSFPSKTASVGTSLWGRTGAAKDRTTAPSRHSSTPWFPVAIQTEPPNRAASVTQTSSSPGTESACHPASADIGARKAPTMSSTAATVLFLTGDTSGRTPPSPRIPPWQNPGTGWAGGGCGR